MFLLVRFAREVHLAPKSALGSILICALLGDF